MLPLSVLEALLTSLERIGCGRRFDEFTMEVNPEDIVEKGHSYVEGLLKLGVDRISMGVQSFDDATLKWMNRRHDSARAKKAYAILEETGVGNISIDLIFGLPQLDLQGWEDNLSKALNVSPSGKLPAHVSSYQLSVEEGSALAAMMVKGKWSEATDEHCAQQYETLCERLREAGYHHYEISNFAQPGYEAVHNSAYWSHVPYVGLGPGAHSFGSVSDKGAERRWNNPDLAAYIAAGVSGVFSAVQGGEILTWEQLELERLMLGLRTSKGLPSAFLERCCSPDSLQSALNAGHLQVADESCSANPYLRIPEQYFFISDSIIADL